MPYSNPSLIFTKKEQGDIIERKNQSNQNESNLKFKMFSGTTSSQLENSVNDWLKEGICEDQILAMSTTCSDHRISGTALRASFLYKE